MLKRNPGIGGYVNSGFDFTTLDTIMPHPMYGSANPGEETFSAVKLTSGWWSGKGLNIAANNYSLAE
jgi:hypothetical protein